MLEMNIETKQKQANTVVYCSTDFSKANGYVAVFEISVIFLHIAKPAAPEIPPWVAANPEMPVKGQAASLP